MPESKKSRQKMTDKLKARIEEQEKDLRGLLMEATSLQPAEVEEFLAPYQALAEVLQTIEKAVGL
jgi:hypothetical protein